MNSDLIQKKKNEYHKNEKIINQILESKKENIEIKTSNNNKIDNNKNDYINIDKNIDKNFLNDYYKMEDLKREDSKTKDGKYIIDIYELLGEKKEEIPITLDILNESFENFPNSKISSRNFGKVKAYAANTSQGIIRDYNEDRVSIVINMVKPVNSPIDDLEWPKISYFGVFDGHAGYKCADYLKDNLLKKIANNKFFPNDIIKAIKFGFQSAEKDFLDNYAIKNKKVIEKSGSCALILLNINNKVYVANVGDSRCQVSCKNGKILKDVTRDHKPNYPYEKERILKFKGNIYQSETPLEIDINDEEESNLLKDKVILGPYRVNPGRLSVSRTIGDVEAKNPEFGGNPNVIISEPDIFVFDLEKDDVDFFILGCDGIYDQLSSKEVLECAWMVFNDLNNDFNEFLNINCGNIIDMILKMAMIRKSYDNVTCLIVAFKDMDKLRNNDSEEKRKNSMDSNNGKTNFFNKINIQKSNYKLNKNQDKTIIINKNRLPLLQLSLNSYKANKPGFKKIFKKNNLFFNYINKISINSNKLRKKEDDDLILRNNNMTHKEKINILNRNILNKIDIIKDKETKDFSQIVALSNNKNIYINPKLEISTEPNSNNNFKNRVNEKSNMLLTDSMKCKKIKSLNLRKNSFSNEENNNSIPIIDKKKTNKNYGTPTTIRVIKDNREMIELLENKHYIKYFSVNKKNTLQIENNFINNSAKQINKRELNLRLKSVENKLPLYKKAFRNSNILERNKKENFLLNNKLNIITYDKISNKDNRNILINNIKNYSSNDDKDNTIKFEKPIKLKLELLNSKITNNKNNEKYHLSENNRKENNMPLIIQPKRIVSNYANI